jgi:hypothetical protein
MVPLVRAQLVFKEQLGTMAPLEQGRPVLVDYKEQLVQ